MGFLIFFIDLYQEKFHIGSHYVNLVINLFETGDLTYMVVHGYHNLFLRGLWVDWKNSSIIIECVFVILRRFLIIKAYKSGFIS